MSNSKIEEGQQVLYDGHEVHVEEVYEDGMVRINNPYWNWDDEAVMVNDGLDYCVPHWISVKRSEIKLITTNK